MDKVYKMSEKEIKKTELMSQLAEKQITQRMAAEHLGISVRQVKRLWRNHQPLLFSGNSLFDQDIFCVRFFEPVQHLT